MATDAVSLWEAYEEEEIRCDCPECGAAEDEECEPDCPSWDEED